MWCIQCCTYLSLPVTLSLDLQMQQKNTEIPAENVKEKQKNPSAPKLQHEKTPQSDRFYPNPSASATAIISSGSQAFHQTALNQWR